MVLACHTCIHIEARPACAPTGRGEVPTLLFAVVHIQHTKYIQQHLISSEKQKELLSELTEIVISLELKPFPKNTNTFQKKRMVLQKCTA